uniref:Protein phosphatase 1 regulatory subunit 14B n=1 Tax=Pavo cristatus TaxID=9049 RepID=A0A8C9FV58_PAVCR
GGDRGGAGGERRAPIGGKEEGAPGPRVCFAAGPEGADGAAVGAEEAAGARRGGKVTVRYDRRELRKRLHLEEWILGQLTALYDCRVRPGETPVIPAGGWRGGEAEGPAPFKSIPFMPRPKPRDPL